MAFHLKHHHPEKQHIVTASKWQARVTRGAKMVRERAMAVLLPRELSHCGIAEHREPLVHWWRNPTC